MSYTGFPIFIPPIVATFYLAALAPNRHPPGGDDHRSLKICRAGAAFLWWSAGFGLIGVGLALAAFALGIAGIVKGRTGYGAVVVVGSVFAPIAAFVGPEGIVTAYVVFWIAGGVIGGFGRRGSPPPPGPSLRGPS